MLKTKVFYVIELESERFYRRNHESSGGIRPTTSIIQAQQYSSFEDAKRRYDELLNMDNLKFKPIGIARFGLLNGNLLK